MTALSITKTFNETGKIRIIASLNNSVGQRNITMIINVREEIKSKNKKLYLKIIRITD